VLRSVVSTESDRRPGADAVGVDDGIATTTSPRAALRKLIDAAGERGGDRYAGADHANAVRITALLWSLCGLLTAIFLPLAEPTEAIGGAGWAIAAAIVISQLVGGAVLRRRGDSVSFGWLLAITYLGLAQMAIMVWLSGGWVSPYSQLMLLWLGAGAGIHPPLRALTFIAVTSVATFLPLTYDGWSSAGIEHAATQWLLFTVLGGILLALMTYVRGQRLALRHQTDSAARLARADPLTGLGNRRAFDEVLEIEIARALTTGAPLSIALLDLDGFKVLNDEFGHLEGDRCLKAVSASLESRKRGPDHVFRWGGDEFAVILPGADDISAETAVHRIAELDPSLKAADGQPLSLCYGIARFASGMTAAELLDRADLKLLDAKQARAEREGSSARD
jgi:diguanylate cyclase (GGDEF)-like protein